MVHTTGWLKGLQVTADGTGIVSHAGVALIRVAQVAPACPQIELNSCERHNHLPTARTI
jgi:hypothetical protein